MKLNRTHFGGGLLVLLLLLATTGCGTKYHTLKLTSEPSGAEVIFDGKTQSNTPTVISVPKDKRDHYLFVGKTGCEEIRKVFRQNEYPQSLNLLLDCDLDQAALGEGQTAGTQFQEGSGISDDQLGRAADGTTSVEGGDGRPMDRERFVNEDVYFAYDSSALNGDAQANLQRKARWLQANPNIAFIIQGHTDERGTVAYNLALGDRRAQRVEAYLREMGITADRMLTVSFGEEQPVDPASNEQAWSRNRRVQFLVY